jgi:RNA polymerase sigma factor (sigma-70 family)
MGVDPTVPDFVSVPRDYTELFTRYREVLCLWAYRFGIPAEWVDDVVASTFEVCLRRDVLGRFDPDRGVKFGSYLLTVLHNHVRDWLSRQARRPREVLFDSALLLGINDQGLSTRLRNALQAGSAGDQHEVQDRLEAISLADSLRRRLADYASNPGVLSRALAQDCLAVWDAAIQQVWDDRWQGVTLATQLGVPRRTLRTWLTEIAEVLRDDLAAVR